MSLTSVIVCWLIVLVCAPVVFGQAQISSGNITGDVLDETDAALPSVNVTANNAERGIRRSTTTDEAGRFTFSVMPPGAYDLRFEAEGFATKVVEGVILRVGDTVAVDVTLAVSAVTTEVSVTADAAVVDSQRTQQATTIETERISELPINQRNYLDFALLAPGVVDTTSMADDTDFRVAQTPQSGLSFGGSNGRGNIFSIDGAEHYSNSGGVRPSVSQEAVREFQINQNSFSAELGGATGGAVNIVTKSGTNSLHGNFFGFLRHRSIQARNYFDPTKSAYTRGQYGATLGGPVRKDKTFFFGAFERLDRHETSFVPILQDTSAFYALTPSQEKLIGFLEKVPSQDIQGQAKQLRQVLTPASNPATLRLFESNSGTFPFDGATTQGSFRLDHQFTDYHQIFFRGSVARDRNDNTEFGALIGVSRGRRVDLIDSTVVLSDTYIFNPTWVMETRAMFSYGNIEVEPTDAIGPELNINGFGLFGRDIFLPSTTIERHYQWRQTFSRIGGKHDLKFGYDINPVQDTAESETFFGGRFGFGEAIPLRSIINGAGDPAAADKLALLLQLFGRPDLVSNLDQPVSALQSFSLGLPIFYQQGFGSPSWTGWSKRYAFFVQDSYRITPHLLLNFGLRYDLEVNPEVIGTDGNNIAPRFGFAWTPSGSHKTVIRGGYGMYYSQINGQIPNVVDTLDGDQISQVFLPLTGVPGVVNPITGALLTSADIYQTLAAQGVIGQRTIAPADLEQFGINVGPNLPLQVFFGADENYVNPWAHQASFEIERAVGDFALSAGYNFNRGIHLPKSLDRNIYRKGTTDDGRPIYGFYNPLIFQNNFYESTANSFYHAMTLRLTRRMKRNVGFDVHYTWSKAIDEVTDFNSDFQPQDQLNARAERALSAFHRGHRVVGNAMFVSPYSLGKDAGVLKATLADWSFSPIVVASSYRPFNVLVGFDNVGDRHPNTHRPHGAGRNIGRGPDYFSVDLRLKRAFRWGERRNIEFLAEVFNVLNRTNFKSINNVAGDITVDDLPRPLEGIRGIPTDPLSFTGALNPRQFQFGVKINY